MIERAFEVLFVLALTVPPVVLIVCAAALAWPRRDATRGIASRHAHAAA